MKRTTTNELSERTGVSVRMVQKTAKALNIPKHKGVYQFTENEAKRIANELNERQTNEPTNDIPPRHTDDIPPKSVDLNQRQTDTIIEEFTPEQYDKLQEVIETYKSKIAEAKHLLEQVDIYKNQLDYMKKSLDKKDDQMNRLIESFQKTIQVASERNHLEYFNTKKKNE